MVINTVLAKDINRDAMQQLGEIFTQAELNIENWEVLIKEKKHPSELHDMLYRLKKEFSFTKDEDELRVKYVFQDGQVETDFVEYYTVVIPKSTAQDFEIIATLQGKSWSEDLANAYAEWKETKRHKWFTNSAKLYACLTTDIDGIMSSDVFLGMLKNELDLVHISTQVDNVKKSKHKKMIYGYTPLWSHTVKMNDKPVNLQLVEMINASGQVKYTIGTPILINEY